MSRYPTYTEKELVEIKQMKREGATNAQIAEMFGRSESGIATLFWKGGKLYEESEESTKNEEPVYDSYPHNPRMFRTGVKTKASGLDFIGLQYYLWQRFRQSRSKNALGGTCENGITAIAICVLSNSCEVNVAFSDGTNECGTIFSDGGIYSVDSFEDTINLILAKHQYRKPQPISFPSKEKTLNDYTPRQIIKHLHELGYRIEDGELVVIEKKKINIHSILTEG